MRIALVRTIFSTTSAESSFMCSSASALVSGQVESECG